MKINRIALLAVVILSIVIVPAAMAEHCFRCKIVPAPEVSYCIEHTSTQFMGWEECTSDEFGCSATGTRCFGHGVIAEQSTPLAAEYTVASVERLDAPQTAQAETAVADATPAR